MCCSYYVYNSILRITENTIMSLRFGRDKLSGWNNPIDRKEMSTRVKQKGLKLFPWIELTKMEKMLTKITNRPQEIQVSKKDNNIILLILERWNQRQTWNVCGFTLLLRMGYYLTTMLFWHNNWVTTHLRRNSLFLMTSLVTVLYWHRANHF